MRLTEGLLAPGEEGAFVGKTHRGEGPPRGGNDFRRLVVHANLANACGFAEQHAQSPCVRAIDAEDQSPVPPDEEGRGEPHPPPGVDVHSNHGRDSPARPAVHLDPGGVGVQVELQLQLLLNEAEQAAGVELPFRDALVARGAVLFKQPGFARVERVLLSRPTNR